MGLGSSSSKPLSNPKNWPYSTEDDVEQRPERIVKVGLPQQYSFCSNFVKTSKYEAWNFLQLFLLEEFNPKTKFANCYFLLVSGLQCIPPISNTGGIPTTLIPLLLVVVIDGIFQIFEDISRHRADKHANSSIALRYSATTNQFEEVPWWEVAVGDFVKINSREAVRCRLPHLLHFSYKPSPSPTTIIVSYSLYTHYPIHTIHTIHTIYMTDSSRRCHYKCSREINTSRGGLLCRNQVSRRRDEFEAKERVT